MRLVPLLVEAGHEVVGMTRSPHKAEALQRAGAEPVVADVYDRDALGRIVADVVVDELTDLPDDAGQLLDLADRNVRIRREGTRNLLNASEGVPRFLVQSVAWDLGGDRAAAVAEMERMVLDRGGVVIRYGQLYGPGTYYEEDLPDPPRVHVDEAARRTVELLDAESGIVTVVDA
jgi:uncharacterized protein YbjT (DUF2867 family)